MNNAYETTTLRSQLSAWAATPPWNFLIRYELFPKKPSEVLINRLAWRAGRTLRLMGLSRSRYLKQRWQADLKHAPHPDNATTLVFWSESTDKALVHQQCAAMKNLLRNHPEFIPVLVTRVADFAFYSRLGCLVEFLPELPDLTNLADSGQSYLEQKKRYLAWRYRNALALPLAVATANPSEFKALVTGSNK